MDVNQSKNKALETDLIESDHAFVNFFGAMLVSISVIMIAMALICWIWEDVRFCELSVISMPWLESIFPKLFFSLHLPIGLLLLGVGLQLFSKIGWFSCMIALLSYAALFFMPLYFLLPHINEEVSMSAVFFLMSIAGILFLSLPSVRRMYWRGKKNE